MMNTQIIEKIFDNVIRSKQVHEAVLIVENTKGDFSMTCGYGNKNLDTLFLMASITKIFTTACILILREQNKLSLNNTLSNYFDKSTLSGLHIFRGVDYSYKITLSDLLFQTSGLADYFEEGGFKNIAIEKDFSMTFEDVLEETKKLKPIFAPNSSKKAYYCDINFDILGEVIEKVAQMPLAEVYRNYIFDPLKLEKTYLPVKDDDFIPNFYYKDKYLHRPAFIKSCRASGGCVSTARELMIFLKAFFNGLLFSKKIFESLSVHRKLQSSYGMLRYGGGYMTIPLNTINTLFLGKGELIGHSGTTGSFAYYYPEKDLYFVGDLNQIASPSLPIRMLMQIAFQVK